MFFRKMTEKEKVNAEKAAGFACIFYMLALGCHAIYSYMQGDRPPVTFILLIAGLLVFFLIEWLLNKRQS
ncbi:hypothetical protein [Bacillus sp. 179-C3.3 HS]|uniref:hypothetical protein n=1 Tax=Bacillus sp. 179-C3.3 HS TaxID=3232162 RepID=UPI0039A17D94